MTKTVATRYFEAVDQARRCKPRSKRRTILISRAAGLLVRQLRIENKRTESRIVRN